MYLLTKYIKSVLWGEAVRLSYIWDAWCLKVNVGIYEQLLFCFSFCHTKGSK